MKFIFSIVSILLAMTIAACNLSGAATNLTTPSPIATSTQPYSQITSIPPTRHQPTATVTADNAGCTPRTDWPTYTIQSGDTLYSILNVSRAGLSIEDLAIANCLDDPNNLSVGQQIYVPNPIRTGDFLVYWINTSTHDVPRRDGSIVSACDQIFTPITSDIPATSDTALNVRNRLELLFNGTGETASNWSSYGFSVGEIEFADGQVTVLIAGDSLLPGHCGDASLQEEMLFTIFEEADVESAQIFIGNRNLRQIIDMSGRAGAFDVYTRENLPPNW